MPASVFNPIEGPRTHPIVLARPAVPTCPGISRFASVRPAQREPVHVRTEPLAVASTVCALTAIIPIVSQVAGLVLGTVGLVRIRRARRAGQTVRGSHWAGLGIGLSLLVLLAWIFICAAFVAVGLSFANTAQTLGLPAPG